MPKPRDPRNSVRDIEVLAKILRRICTAADANRQVLATQCGAIIRQVTQKKCSHGDMGLLLEWGLLIRVPDYMHRRCVRYQLKSQPVST